MLLSTSSSQAAVEIWNVAMLDSRPTDIESTYFWLSDTLSLTDVSSKLLSTCRGSHQKAWEDISPPASTKTVAPIKEKGKEEKRKASDRT
jgi:hypothetical protein